MRAAGASNAKIARALPHSEGAVARKIYDLSLNRKPNPVKYVELSAEQMAEMAEMIRRGDSDHHIRQVFGIGTARMTMLRAELSPKPMEAPQMPIIADVQQEAFPLGAFFMPAPDRPVRSRAPGRRARARGWTMGRGLGVTSSARRWRFRGGLTARRIRRLLMCRRGLWCGGWRREFRVIHGDMLVKLITPPGGTVLDPFSGSGTTLLAADRLQFDAIGIEQSATYVEDIKRRMQSDAPLFAELSQ